ncbi:MAG: hypothetical protein HYZ57_20965 [Acidobacteria bacterium]|nr:hypothetical protein [Acidobacteriota bacterium]MBI3282297.1 hypothetical protein [Acidobacteriota bacterium]
MLLLLVVAAFCPVALAQERGDARVEITAAFWRASVEGTLDSGIFPVDLQRDLALEERFTFFGKLAWRPAGRHRILIEGAPYRFSGRNRLRRDILFQGRVYSVEEEVVSEAEVDYLFAGYQYDLLRRPQGHLGLQVGAAYLDASGKLRSVDAGVEASRAQKIGLPLAGMEFRVFVLPRSRLLSATGEVKGMTLGDYGRYVHAVFQGGVAVGRVTLQAGYGVLDADIHEKGNASARAGIAPRFHGPVFSVQLRDR